MYCSTTGTFLQRDPLSSSGIEVLYDDNYVTSRLMVSLRDFPTLNERTNLYAYVANNPLKYVDPMGLKVVDTGVQACDGYQRSSWLFSRFSLHGFLTIDGRGYGLFERYLNSIGTSDIRDTDLITYPENGAGDFYSTCVPIKLEDCCYDIDKFKQLLRDKIAHDSATPGTYCAIGANCFTWRTGSILDAIDGSWNGRCFWTKKCSKFNDFDLPQLNLPAGCK
jgi:hypothetical protein